MGSVKKKIMSNRDRGKCQMSSHAQFKFMNDLRALVGDKRAQGTAG
jgi:hypothetical protein